MSEKKQGNFDISDAGFNVGVNVRIRQRDKETGKILQERQVHNRCLKTELLAIVKFLDGQFNTTMPYNLSRNYIPNYLGVGTNTATYDASASVTSSVSISDTRLLHEIGPRMQLPQKNTIINKSSQDYIQLVIVAYLPSEYYNGYTLREAGLFSKASGNNCLFRVTFDGIEKTEDTVVEVNWTISVISVESQHDAYESVDKTDLKKMMDIVLDKIGEILPDVSQATDHLKDPAIMDYKNTYVSQAKVDEDTALLRTDYLAIKDLDPLSPVIPPDYIYTGEGTITANDVVKDKIGYSQGEEITGTMEELEEITITKTSYSDFTTYTDGNNRQYLRITSNPNVGTPGTNKYISSGSLTEYMNIPVDILAAYFGLDASKIKYGETIMGIQGTYVGAMSQADYNSALDDINDILGEV